MLSPRITFGVIVLNGEPFTRYNLRALYPFAHEIIVVEGASPHAASAAGADGHSADGTLECLRRFKLEEDPEDKLRIVTAEDEGHTNGFWPGEKDEQSRAYARRATGNWLWQIDIDEFYRPEDMQAICELLSSRSDLAAVSFNQIQFWGGLDYMVDGWYLRYHSGREFHRLFRWGPGYSYATHRPPTVLDERGHDLRRKQWLSGAEMARSGIYLYHYSLVFPFQVGAKSRYYSSIFGRQAEWADHYYMRLRNPYRVHNVHAYPSWLERYEGDHPPQVEQLWSDVNLVGNIELRQNEDVERLIDSIPYRFGRARLKIVGAAYYQVRRLVIRAFRALPISARNRLRRLRPAMARMSK